ncbi:MAG TPA: hypothetical protein C5S37_07385 [Methanophagales archaeon]|nr:hypothetical protein [Methanophagales archaeon]
MIGGKERDKEMRMKKVIGVAALIMVVMAIVLIAFSSTASASFLNRTFTQSGGTLNYTGSFKDEPRYEPAENILLVYNWESGKKAGGEEIRFFNLSSGTNVSVYVEGPQTKKAEQYSGYEVERQLVPAGGVWDAEGRKTSGYFMVWEKDNESIGGWFQVVKQKFSVELGGEREKVQEGKNFSLRLKSNNKEGKVMKLTIEDNEGYSIMNADGTDIYKVLVNYTKVEGKPKFTSDPVTADGTPVNGIKLDEGELVFNTTQLDMTEGKYEIILEDYATEAKEEVDIKVEKRYLKVECDEEVVKGDDIVIIIESSFYEENVNVTAEKLNYTRSLTLDEEGKKKVKIRTESVDYGRYKVTVEVRGMWDTKYVMIKRSGTTLEVPENATVGDIVHIEGTSETGDLAVFVIDDIFEGEATISDDEFEWEWDTSGKLDGYRGIEVFILSEAAPFKNIGDDVSEDWQREEGVDASSSIFLNYPAFSMTVSKSIAKGDPVVINGTVTGADHVYVIVFNYRGDVMFPYTKDMSAVNAVPTPVEEGKWTETLSALDFGEYTVIALDKGRDGRTRAINENDEWEIGGESKTLEQRVAILIDAITFVGSDDLYGKACFSVSAPEVILTVPETVEIGTAISVKGETNIKDGMDAFVSLLFDSSVMDKTTVVVASGSVSASFNTSGLQPGRYNVAVDVSGRASDEKEVVLVEKGKEPIPKNGSLPEPTPEAVKEGNESEGEFLNETREGWEEAHKKIPVNMCDLLIAVVVASAILAVARRRRRRR